MFINSLFVKNKKAENVSRRIRPSTDRARVSQLLMRPPHPSKQAKRQCVGLVILECKNKSPRQAAGVVVYLSTNYRPRTPKPNPLPPPR